LLNILTSLLRFGRIWAQNFAHFVHCFALFVADDMPVDPECDACVRVSHLFFRDSWICAHVH
jgi:hypothetical protein